MVSKTTFQPTELANTLRVALLFGFRMLGLFMIFPILATDVNLNLSATPTLIGIALGIYGLTQASLQIPFGLLSDQYGRRKIIVLGLLFFIAGSLIAANAENIYQLIFGRALQGCGAIASVLLAYLADLTRVQVRIRSMATVGMSIGFSFLLSLILGPILYQFIGLSGIFYGTAVLGCVGLLLLFTIKDTRHPAQSNKALEYKFSFSAMFSVWKIKSLWSLNIIVMVIHACITLIFLFIPALLIEHNYALAEHWQVYLFTMLSSLVFALPLIIWTEKKQKIRISIVFSLALLLFTFFLFFKSASLIFLIIALILFFVSFNVLEALLPSSVSRIAPVEYRGMALGLFSSNQFLGSFIGGSMGGMMLHYFGLMGLLCCAIILITLCLLIFLIIPIDIQKRSQTYTISPNYETIKVEQWAKKQAGVLEVVYQTSNGDLYLKTDLNNFDEEEFNLYLTQQFH